MQHTYQKSLILEYKKQLFQVIVRDDLQYGFLKIVDREKMTYEYPTAYEFLHLNSFMHPNNRIKF